jgi:hypothetical protein
MFDNHRFFHVAESHYYRLERKVNPKQQHHTNWHKNIFSYGHFACTVVLHLLFLCCWYNWVFQIYTSSNAKELDIGNIAML